MIYRHNDSFSGFVPVYFGVIALVYLSFFNILITHRMSQGIFRGVAQCSKIIFSEYRHIILIGMKTKQHASILPFVTLYAVK